MSYRIPDTLAHEIDELQELVSRFLAGALTGAELKARRVPFGVYEQRVKGAYMVRIRCPAGIITPGQLAGVAHLADHFGSGLLHLTTRQEVQVHDVHLESVVPLIRGLRDIGLSTRGGGGNTVRNITASWDAGVARDEVFDVTPHAVALTERLIDEPDSWLLPRKYKIAFSNSSADNAYATVSDLGFVAAVRDGFRGFRVYVAGGMGRMSQAGHLLYDFAPESDVYVIAEAVKRLFAKYGNRRNKHAARLRFLWNSLGREGFLRRYEEELTAVRGEGRSMLDLRDFPIDTPPPPPTKGDAPPGLDLWRRRYVRPQRQDGLHAVVVPVFLGMFRSHDARSLAGVVAELGNHALRLTPDQNLSVRNVPNAWLGHLYHELREIFPDCDRPAQFSHAVACAGAGTCQLGICRSRGALTAVADRLASSAVDLDVVPRLRLHISGCSNTCGQHMIADLGFYGKAARKGQRMYPAYAIVAGARVGGESTQLAEKIDEISARDLPTFVEELLADYGAPAARNQSFRDYLSAGGTDAIRRICGKYRDVPEYAVSPEHYRDWDTAGDFSLAGRGTGECSAGLFDLIDIDLARVKRLREDARASGGSPPSGAPLYDLTLAAARMLLITRGVEAAGEGEVFGEFERHFIDAGLVDQRFRQVLRDAAARDSDALAGRSGEVLELTEAVERLYASMDDSLRFDPSGPAREKGEPAMGARQNIADVIKDLRGVGCPMNFVKTKLELAGMKAGQILQVMLDDGEPIENVPRSVQAEGHRVVSQNRIVGYWLVTIQKAA